MAQILIIDDDPQFRKTLFAILTKANYDVLQAENGNEELRVLSTNACDLVISDIFMPEKEGIETITEIRADYPDMKIIAISGGMPFSSTDFLGIAEKLGADITIQKPFEREVILQAVSELLESG